jgi:hypothetical protein
MIQLVKAVGERDGRETARQISMQSAFCRFSHLRHSHWTRSSSANFFSPLELADIMACATISFGQPINFACSCSDDRLIVSRRRDKCCCRIGFFHSGQALHKFTTSLKSFFFDSNLACHIVPAVLQSRQRLYTPTCDLYVSIPHPGHFVKQAAQM